MCKDPAKKLDFNLKHKSATGYTLLKREKNTALLKNSTEAYSFTRTSLLLSSLFAVCVVET